MTRHHDHLDDSLRPLSDALDELGARERASAPAGLEQRLLARTLPVLRGEAHADTPDETPEPIIARIGFGRTMRLAAAVALVATAGIGALFILRAGGPTTTQPLATTETLINAIDTETDDWLSDLDSLQATADTTSSTTSDFWTLPDEDALDPLLGEENS